MLEQRIGNGDRLEIVVQVVNLGGEDLEAFEEHGTVILPLAGKGYHAWISNNLEALQMEYSEQWVAVHKKQVVAASVNLNELLEMVPNPTETCIEFISAEPLEIVL